MFGRERTSAFGKIILIMKEDRITGKEVSKDYEISDYICIGAS